MDNDTRWQALKGYLSTQIKQDDAVRASFHEMGDTATASAHGALVSANRSTLAKMRELERN